MAIEIGRINVGNGGYGNNQLIVRYDLVGQYIAENYSTIRAYLYFDAPVRINFDRASASLHTTGWYAIQTSYTAGEHLIGTLDFNVWHNDVGKASFAIGYGIDTSFLVSGSGVTTTVPLPTIPRTSEITKLDAFDVEGDIKVGVNKKYIVYKDTLQLYLGSTLIKTIDNYASDTVFTLTKTELDTVFERMKNTNSSDFTVKITTYNGSSIIGTTSKNAKGTIYNAAPLFNAASFVATNHLDIADDQTIIKGYSNIEVRLTAAVAQKKATIISYKVVCGSSISQQESLIHELTNVDESIIKCYAIDSRGNTTEVILNVEKFIQYTPITLDSLEIHRMQNESGTECALSFGGLLWTGNFGLIENTITAQYFYKESNAADWVQGTSDIAPLTNAHYVHEAEVKGDLGALGFDKGKAYQVKVIVADKLSSNERETELTKFRGLLYFHDDGIAFGGEYDDSLFQDRTSVVQFYNAYTDRLVPIEDFLINTAAGVRSFDNKELDTHIEKTDVVWEDTSLLKVEVKKYLDFAKYKKLKFYLVINGIQQHTATLDITRANTKIAEAGWAYELVDLVGASDKVTRIWRIDIRVTTSKDAVCLVSVQFSDNAGASFTPYHHDETGIYKIEGIY